MDQNRDVSTLRFLDAPARKVVIGLRVFIAVLALTIVADAMDYLQYAQLPYNAPAEIDEGTEKVIFYSLAYGLYVLSFLVSGFLVLRWIYRINQNARELAPDKPISPGWAVGWYFVPVLALWKPFQAMREAWQISTDPANWRTVAVPPLLRQWWGFWIVGNILDQVSARMFLKSHSAGTTMTSDVLSIAGSAAAIVTALLLIRIVKELTQRQMSAIATSIFWKGSAEADLDPNQKPADVTPPAIPS